MMIIFVTILIMIISKVFISKTIDSSNNIIVTGYYQANITIYNAPGGSLDIFGTLPISGGADTFIVKYDSNGAGIWATRIAGPVTGNGISTSVSVDSLKEYGEFENYIKHMVITWMIH